MLKPALRHTAFAFAALVVLAPPCAWAGEAACWYENGVLVAPV